MRRYSNNIEYLERLSREYRKFVEDLGPRLSPLYISFNDLILFQGRLIGDLCRELDKLNLNIKLSINRRIINMDKQINKVKKDVMKNDKPKAKKDIKKLMKMDKKFDAKLEKCDEKMMAKSKKK